MDETQLELLIMSYGLDHICEDNDINPIIVLRWILENYEIEDYFE